MKNVIQFTSNSPLSRAIRRRNEKVYRKVVNQYKRRIQEEAKEEKQGRQESTTEELLETLATTAYAIYRSYNMDKPKWDDLPEDVKHAWRVIVANRIKESFS